MAFRVHRFQYRAAGQHSFVPMLQQALSLHTPACGSTALTSSRVHCLTSNLPLLLKTRHFWLFLSGKKLLRVYGTRRCFADVEKRGRGNASWAEQPPGKIFGEAMHMLG